MLDAYAYVNAMIDANSAITRMVFPPAVYAVVTGPVPEGQPAISGRIVCEAGDGSTDDTFVYDADLFLFSVMVNA
jgi:hypothetical protein